MTYQQYKSSTLRKSFTATKKLSPLYSNNSIGENTNFNIMSNISSNIMIDPAIIQISNSSQHLTLPCYSAPPGISVPVQSHLQLSVEYSTSWQSSSDNSNIALSTLPLTTNFQNIWSYLPQQPQIQSKLQQQSQVQINPDEYNMQLRQTLFETLKTIIYSNNGLIYGEYIINEIQCQYMSDEFYKQLQIMYPKEKYNMTLEYLQNAFNNPNILPEFVNRLNKYTNTIDIIIRKCDIVQFHKEIQNTLGNYYKVTIGNTILLSTIYPDWANECSNLATYPIIIISKYISKYMEDIVTLNVMMDVSVDVSVETEIQSRKQLNLPYGIYDFQEQYIMSDGKMYQLPESIHAFVPNTEIFINDLILKVQRKVCILMPYAIGDSEKIKKYLEFKNIILDCIIKNDTKDFLNGDYYITNQHKGLNCAGCNVSIDSEENCAVLKCCTSPFHFQCLLECYISAEDNTTLNCSKCNTSGKLDFEGKNSSILMGILG